jgi:hypothetical protein
MTFTFNRKLDMRALDMFASLQQLRPRCSQNPDMGSSVFQTQEQVILRSLVEPDV